MTELEVRAGEALERQMDRYARLRLEPSSAQAKRARAAVMEAAWRQRLTPVLVERAEAPVAATVAAGTTPSTAVNPRRHGLFAGWSARRIGVSLAAASLAGLMVGTTAFAGTRAGAPLYDVRLAVEELTLPAGGRARLEAELALAQGRLAEIVDAAARNDPGAVSAAVRGYQATLDELDTATGGPADRALVAVQYHHQVLLDVLASAPVAARSGLERAIASSATSIGILTDAGRHPTVDAGGAGNGTGTSNGSNRGGAGAGPTSGGSGNGGTSGQGGNGNGGSGQGGSGQGGNGQGGGPVDPAKPSKEPPAKTPVPAQEDPTKVTRTPNPGGGRP